MNDVHAPSKLKDGLIRMLAAAPVTRVMAPLLGNRASIFMLHRLRAGAIEAGHSLDEVRALVAALRRTGTPIVGLRELLARDLLARADGGRRLPHAVAFTIDDGFADQGALAEAFIGLGCPVTLFVVAGFIDGQLWPWDDQVAAMLRRSLRSTVAIDVSGFAGSYALDDRAAAIDRLQNDLKRVPHAAMYSELLPAIAVAADVPLSLTPPPEHAPLSWDELRALKRAGVEIGAHSVTHRIFSRLEDAEAAHEIASSLARVRDELATPAPLFAWPTGRTQDFTPRDLALLRGHGIPGAFATNDNYADFGRSDADARFCLDRFALPHDVGNTLQYGGWIERGKQLLRGG